MVLLFFLLSIPDRDSTHLPTRQKLAQLDALGIFFLLPGVICLLLALQWGGSTYAWRNGRIIALLVLAGVLSIAFVVVQILRPETATIPPRIFKQRSIIAGVWATFCIGAGMMIFVYYLPVWFQGIEGVSAVDSGIRLLPMVLSMVVASIASGTLTGRVGYYTPFMIFGVVVFSIGAGLITTFHVGIPESRWIGYQILYGFGLGCCFQAPNLAAQTVLATADVPVGTSLVIFSQLIGGAIFTSVGSNILSNQLLQRLPSIPGVDTAQILTLGATEIIASVPESARAAVLIAYNASLVKVFQVGLAMTCLTIFGALAMEWRSVKSKKPHKDAEAGGAGESADEEKKVAGVQEGDKAVEGAETATPSAAHSRVDSVASASEETEVVGAASRSEKA